ncbi:MAG: M48 family metallopeptidase [Chlamydiota bacterium]|nr:M48 family metallopeptidase [Chlamydiota bacterium]
MWEQIRANKRKTAILIVIMAGVLFLAGFALGEVFARGGGLIGLFIAFIIWLFLTTISYFGGDSIFLSMSGAKKIEHKDHPILFNVVEEITIAAGLAKVPDIYIIDDASPNAFATGRTPEKAAVAVTAGLLEKLNRDELQGVIAHEMAHIKNRDVLYMIMVGVMMGTIVFLADIGLRHLFWSGTSRRTSSRSSGSGQGEIIILIVAIVLMILAPILAQLIYFAISRKREYLADACSAQFTRYPEGLASALQKISASSEKMRRVSRATAPMYIINPLKPTKKGMSNLSSTHPPISERIKILRSMAGGAGYMDYDQAYQKVTGRSVGVIPLTSLQASEKTSAKTSKSDDARTQLNRIRQTTDLLWKLNQYIFIACSCGVKMKIPPIYVNRKIPCPHCNKEHSVQLSQA